MPKNDSHSKLRSRIAESFPQGFSHVDDTLLRHGVCFTFTLGGSVFFLFLVYIRVVVVTPFYFLDVFRLKFRYEISSD